MSVFDAATADQWAVFDYDRDGTCGILNILLQIIITTTSMSMNTNTNTNR